MSSAESSTRLLTYADAIREATFQLMEEDARVFVMGLDVDDHKAIQGTTRGLAEHFGSQRCFSTPLSEDAMTGVAIGAAMAGYKLIHVHIRMDFLLLAMNQLINVAAKAHYMYGGQVQVPLTVRTIVGRSWGQGAQHSQALHAFFMHTPGILVAAPSNAHDAKGTLAAAVDNRNPVIHMEHRLLYSQSMHVPAALYRVSPGKARVWREGGDITVVAISHMVQEAQSACERLEAMGVHAELIDPVWLKPLDYDTIITSVRKTGRLLVVDNGWLACGAAAEIIATIVEALQQEGKVPLCSRMGFAESPCPTAKSLEQHFYPDASSIATRVLALCGINESLLSGNDNTPVFRGPF